ncbi:MAG: S41 family peptidase [Saprospiraceae bacterium]
MYDTEQKENNFPKWYIWMPLLLGMATVFGILIGTKLPSNAPAIVVESNGQQDVNPLGQGKVEELLRYIEAKYVDDVDRDALVNEAIENIIKQLDPHSNYISAEQLREVNEQLEGNFEGIGIEFLILDDTITVVSPLSGGPSETVGVLAGDKIVEIEDTLIVGSNITNRDVVERLRGEKGTDVTIGVLRGSENDVRDFTITRDKIPMHSVDAGFMLDNKTGYIKINRFSATTYEEFMKQLEDLSENQNLKNLLIDVRHNPGGYLQQATNILSQLFREKGKLLVYTEGRTVSRNDYETTGRNFFPVEKIAVLIDEGSASASEILAGAMQDHDRGILIGRRSFGKGLVQEQYNLKDGAALRLTVARYYTPSGRSIQKAYDDDDAYDRDVIDRYESGELLEEDKTEIADSTEFYTLNEKRVVYSGGGIQPDIFVPLDTIAMNDYYLDLRQHIPTFIFPYMQENGAKYGEMKLADFKSNFNAEKDVLQDFLDFAYSKGVAEDAAKLAPVRNEVKRFLKARIARFLYGDEGFYSIWTEQDEVVRKALEAIEDENLLRAEN